MQARRRTPVPARAGSSRTTEVVGQAADPATLPELLRERNRLLLAAAAGRAGVWDYSIDEDSLHCDARWYEILGLDPTQPITSIEQFKPHIHPDDVARATEINPRSLAELVAGNEDYHLTFRIIRADGAVRWVRSAACLTEIAGERPRRAVGFIVDITESRLAEQRLRASLESLRKAEAELQQLNASLEMRIRERTREYERVWIHSRDLQVVIGIDGIFRAVSPAWTDVLGHLPHEIVGRSFLELIPAEDERHARRGLERAAASDHLTNFQNRVLHRDGTVRWIAWHTSVEGTLVYAYGRDVTGERAALEALKQSETHLRAIFHTSYQHQSLLSPQGTVLDANSIALESIGCTLAEVVGLEFWKTRWFVATPDVAEAVRDAVSRAAAGERIRREIEVVLPGGEPRCFDFTLRPLYAGDGTVTAIVHEAVDLTERRNAEAALRQSQKLEAIGKLTSGIAHDFGNLLQGVVAPLHLAKRLLQANRTREIAHCLDNAIASATRGSAATRRLLTYAGRRDSHREPVEIDRMLTDMQELLRQSIGPGIDLALDLRSSQRVLADTSEFENVVLNLCINARDAMPRGGRIEIATSDVTLTTPEAQCPAGDYVHLRVADTGEGMSQQVIDRAFDPFFTTKQPGKGTGLGLYMVSEFVRSLGGGIHLSSRQDRGSMVHMYLPVSSRRRRP